MCALTSQTMPALPVAMLPAMVVMDSNLLEPQVPNETLSFLSCLGHRVLSQ